MEKRKKQTEYYTAFYTSQYCWNTPRRYCHDVRKWTNHKKSNVWRA